MPRYPRKSRVFKPHVRVPAPKRLPRRRLRPPRHYMGGELDREVSDISVGEIEEKIERERKQLGEALQIEGVGEEVEIPTVPEVELEAEAATQIESEPLELAAEEVPTTDQSFEPVDVELPEPPSAVEHREEAELPEISVVQLTSEDAGGAEFAYAEPQHLEERDFEESPVSPLDIEEPMEPQFAQAELLDIEEPASVQVNTEDYAYEPEEQRVGPLDLNYEPEFAEIPPPELDEMGTEVAQISDLQELDNEQYIVSIRSENIEIPDFESEPLRSDPEEQYAALEPGQSPNIQFNWDYRNFTIVPDVV